MEKRNFSLVELLVVIGIIALLAGLMIPAVMSSKTQGMITQAKADMTAIKMALVGVERDYKTILSVSGGDVKRKGGGSADLDEDAVSKTLKPKGASAETAMKVVTYSAANETKYDALIKELSDPKEVTSAKKNFNFRNVKYLDPRSDYSVADTATWWRDPWGNPYVIKIDTAFTDMIFIELPSGVKKDDIPNLDNDKKYLIIRGKVAIYSYGPNGEDNASFNADNGGAANMDDIRGWEK